MLVKIDFIAAEPDSVSAIPVIPAYIEVIFSGMASATISSSTWIIRARDGALFMCPSIAKREPSRKTPLSFKSAHFVDEAPASIPSDNILYPFTAPAVRPLINCSERIK